MKLSGIRLYPIKSCTVPYSIPVVPLFENLMAGATVEEFLGWCPGSSKSDIDAVLRFVADLDSQEAA